jgi:hypothetical protein
MITHTPAVKQVFNILSLVLTTSVAVAQFGERPDLVGSGSPAVDASGRSVKNPRVRAIHTTDPSLLGGTAHLQDQDPFLAYQLGRNLNFREFRSRDGVFDSSNISGLAGPMPDGTTAKITSKNQTSCAGCHNLPNGNAGGGVNFHKDSGFGRNTPHYYGAGIMEMLALQVRQQLLSVVDTNRDGWVSVSESQVSPPRLFVSTGTSTSSQAGPMVDYGTALLSSFSTGSPGLNNIFRVWYVDASGIPVPGATSVDGVTTHGFNFEMIVWGWGQGVGRSALNPTNRAFFWDPMIAHSGLESFDPSTTRDPDGDGVSEPTLAGAIQFPVTHQPNDAGTVLDVMGFSRDDPDGDGYLNEISEGDLDLAEWFMLNVPRPAFAGTPREYYKGVRTMKSLGCTDCHQPDWKIISSDESGDSQFSGDRRFFDLDVQWNPMEARLEGALHRLYDIQGSSYVRRFDEFQVEGIFTDLAHHEMGPGFEELGFDGTLNSTWRTPPLWGVGSGFPWGHDGNSLTLEDAIQRHGGEAGPALGLWLSASPAARASVVSFLSKLVLYDVESLPTDVDADNVISADHVVAGVGTGFERFNAEWLFKVPVQIQGMVANFYGQPINSFAAINLSTAYGLTLPLRVDTDLDGWPDVWDLAPGLAGYKDGVR